MFDFVSAQKVSMIKLGLEVNPMDIRTRKLAKFVAAAKESGQYLIYDGDKLVCYAQPKSVADAALKLGYQCRLPSIGLKCTKYGLVINHDAP